MVPSSWIKFPTVDEPNNKFKYASIDFNLGKNLVSINRTAYSVLDWLGDWGGLMDALLFVSHAFMAPISALALQSSLSSSLVRFQRSAPPNPGSANHDRRQTMLREIEETSKYQHRVKE